MKDSKTVLPTVNGGTNEENKNGFHQKSKIQENGTDSDEHISSTIKPSSDSEELVGGCCVCSDDQGFANNALVYCDGKSCTVACHTACYGIVSIPDGDWYCGRCEAGDVRAPCRLCPTIEGAMKRTSDGGWSHVVCALYIPEVSFGDDTVMEPIILSKIPSARFGQECTICVQNGRSKLIATSGACCSCTAKNCSQVFHVTCAQANGLLCEDVRKNNCQYPIYCEQHRPKLSKFIRQIPAFQYSPNALASTEQLKRQHLFLKEKESPSQLSDFVAAAAAEAAETNTTDEQQTSVSRTQNTSDNSQRKASSNTNSSSISPIVQQKSHSRSSSSSSSTNSSLQKKPKLNDETTNNRSLNDLSQFVQLNKEDRNFLPPPPPNQPNEKDATIQTKETLTDNSKSSNPNLDQPIEEKSLASRCSVVPSSSSSNESKSPIKQRQSTDISSPIKSLTIKKTTIHKSKDDDDDHNHDDDYEINKKRKISIKLNKDGQPRKKRQHSTDDSTTGPRPVGRPPSKKTTIAQQQLTNGDRRPFAKTSSNNMKQSKLHDISTSIQTHSSENETDHESKSTSRSTHYFPCDNFGNQINSDAFKAHEHYSDEQYQRISSDGNDETSRSRLPSTSTTRIDFYPRRPIQSQTSTSSVTTDQQQRTFPPQTLEEFLEQEWESTSDFLLQQTMPHDVSALLSCLYQFKSENASLQKKFDELKHRRDSLRVTNANLRRKLSEILPINDTISPSIQSQASSSSSSTAAAAAATSATITRISPPPPPPPPPPQVSMPSSSSSSSSSSTIVPLVPPSPRKEQQHLKQQKLLAELELQQQLQQQKTISPTRRRPSSNTPSSQYSDSSHHSVKKSKSPRQSIPVSHQSLLENQLRQSTGASTSATTTNNNTSSTKKSSSSSVTVPTNKKLSSSEMELVSHRQPTPTTTPGSSITSTATTAVTSAFEPIDVAATAAAAYALAKNGRAPANPALSLELISQILAASGTAISPQLFAPTWNISNFGYANFPGANPMSVSDESLLRSFAPPATSHPSLEQQQHQQQSHSSTKQQP